MWQLIKDFIFMDALHTICFWSLVGIAIIGLVEIIYQICIARKKIIFADEFIKHIYTIHAHVAKRIESSNYLDTKSLNEIANDLHFVEIHQKEARNSIDTESYKDPIYSLYCLLYYHNWNDNEANMYCHQISIDYETSRNKHIDSITTNLKLLVIPFTKLYRGFCVLFRLLTFPIKKIFTNFDSSKKWEMSISALVEIIALINVIIEFVKTIS